MGRHVNPFMLLGGVLKGRLPNPSLNPSGVSPGNYSNTNLIVGVDGRLTFAQSGVGPGGGGSSSANVTPDTHPASATAWDDEFEHGSVLDTTGSRFSGANSWSILAPTGYSFSSIVAQGALQYATYSGISSSSGIGMAQALPSSGTWEFSQKSYYGNLVLINNSTWKSYYLGYSGGTTIALQQETRNWSSGAYTYGSNLGDGTATAPFYLKLSWDGTNYNFFYSSGGYSGTYIQIASYPPSAWIGTPTHIATLINTTNTLNIDWFRRTA